MLYEGRVRGGRLVEGVSKVCRKGVSERGGGGIIPAPIVDTKHTMGRKN